MTKPFKPVRAWAVVNSKTGEACLHIRSAIETARTIALIRAVKNRQAYEVIPVTILPTEQYALMVDLIKGIGCCENSKRQCSWCAERSELLQELEPIHAPSAPSEG